MASAQKMTENNQDFDDSDLQSELEFTVDLSPGCTARTPVNWRASPDKLRKALRELRIQFTKRTHELHLMMRDIEKIATWIDRKESKPSSLVDDFVQSTIIADPYCFVRASDVHATWRKWYAQQPRKLARISRNILYVMLDEVFGTRTFFQGFRGWGGIRVLDTRGQKTRKSVEVTPVRLETPPEGRFPDDGQRIGGNIKKPRTSEFLFE